MKIHLLPLSVAIAVLVASGCKQKSRFAIDTGQYPKVEFQRLDRDLLTLDTARIGAGVRTLYCNYPGFFPAYVTNVLGMNPAGKEGYQTIEAEVPMAEMSDFSTFMRQATQGRGSFRFDFVRYEEAPAMVAQKVIEEAKAAGQVE